MTALALFAALLCTLGAIGALAYALFGSQLTRIGAHRRGLTAAPESALSMLARKLSEVVDKSLRSGKWTPVTALELELAGISTTVGNFIVTVVAFAVTAVMFVTVLSGSIVLGLLAGLFVPILGKTTLSSRASKRRAAFDEQLDNTLQLLASALRAGHSLQRAIDTTSRDSASPTAEEFGRILNENRIGRDLVESMHTTADRMESEDFHWVAEGVSVQRDTGGNLNEVLDRVGDTIRERHALRREIRTLSSEGRASAVVLLVLPAVVGVTQFMINPEGTRPLYTTTTGYMALGASALLYLVGGFWMRNVVRVKI